MGRRSVEQVGESACSRWMGSCRNDTLFAWTMTALAGPNTCGTLSQAWAKLEGTKHSSSGAGGSCEGHFPQVSFGSVE